MNIELLRAAMAANKCTPKPHNISGLGDVFIRNLTIAETEENNNSKAKGEEGEKNTYARNLLRMLCDAKGNRLPFTEEDVAAMGLQPIETLLDAQKKIDQAVGLGTPGAEEAKKG